MTEVRSATLSIASGEREPPARHPPRRPGARAPPAGRFRYIIEPEVSP